MTTLGHETWMGAAVGASCTTGNTIFDRLMSRWTFDNAHLPTGSTQVGKVSATGQTAQAQKTVTTSDRAFEEIMLYATAAPPADVTFANFRSVPVGGVSNTLCDLVIRADQSIAFRNNAFTQLMTAPAGALHLGQFTKIQRSYDNVAGQARLRVHWTDPYGNTPDYDSGIVGCPKAGQIGIAQIGFITAATWTAWAGVYDLNDTGFLIPVTPPGSAVTPVAATSASTTDSGHNTSITVPGGVAVGNLMVIEFVAGQAQTTVTGPAGWTAIPITQSVANNLQFNAWQKVAVLADLGSTVTVTIGNTASVSRALHFNAYSGGKLGSPASAMASSSSTAHSTPSVGVLDSAAHLLCGAADRAAAPSTSWTVPSGATQKTVEVTTGAAAVSSVTADKPVTGTGATVAGTFTGTIATTKACAWSIAIEPVGAVSQITVSGGPDLFVEPFRPMDPIVPVATGGTPDSWSWALMSTTVEQSITPGLPPSILIGSTMDANGTLHLTPPGWLGLAHFTLRVSGHKSGQPDATDNVVVSVYPATRGFVTASGTITPLRYQWVT